MVTCKNLHNPSKIILTIHKDCGYGVSIGDFDKAIQICKYIFGDNADISTEYLDIK